MTGDEHKRTTSPDTCDRCYAAWLDGSIEFSDACVSGCREAYDAWYYGGVGL